MDFGRRGRLPHYDLADVPNCAPACVTVHCALDTARPMRYERLMRHHVLILGLCLAPVRLFAAEAPATFKVSEFTFTRPSAW